MSKDYNPEKHFKKLHDGGFKGLFYIYGRFYGLLSSRSLWVAFVVSAIVIYLVWNANKSNKEIISYINSIIDIGISVDGGLLGLSLAGLTLVVTFGSGDFMKAIVNMAVNEAQESNKFKKSIYQSTTAKFGFAVFIQILTLITLIIVKVIIKVELHAPLQVAKTINFTVIFLSIFLLLYSLFLVAQMTLNIFTLGQENHLVYFEKVLGEKKEEKKQ